MATITTADPTSQTPVPRAVRRDFMLLRIVKSPWFARALFPVICLIVWLVGIEILDQIWPFMTESLATPREVWDAMVSETTDLSDRPASWPNIYEEFGRSLRRLGIGLVISMVVGTAIGVAMGLSKAADAFWHDWVMVLLAMPALAWGLFIPLAFGFTDRSAIIVVVTTGIAFVIVNVKEGVRNAPSDLFAMARAFDIPQSKIIRHVLLPSLMPFLFASARYAFSIGWKGLAILEVFSVDGAGWGIKYWYDAHRLHSVIAYAAFFILFALAMDRLVLEPLSRRAFKWRPAIDAPELVEQAFDPDIPTPTPTTDTDTDTRTGGNQ